MQPKPTAPRTEPDKRGPDAPSPGEAEGFFQLSLDLLCIAGTDGYFRRVNPAFEQTLGYTPEELLARPFLDFVHADDRAATVAEVEKLADGDATVSFENRYACKDGSYRWLAWKAEPTPDGTIYAVARDVTGRMRVEQSLRESGARARAILETTVDAIITIDERGVVESFNAAAERIFGYAADEVIGRNVKVLMPPPYRAEHDGYMQNYLETGHRKIIGIGREVVGRRQDGSTFPMELAVSEVQLGDRRLFTGIVRDVTRRKEAEENLRTSEERLRMLYLTTLRPTDSLQVQVEEVLRLTTDLLHLDVGLLSRIDGATYTVVACSSDALAAGQTFSLGQTYCTLTLESDDVLAIDHMAVSEHRRHPCYEAFALESYIGIPIYVDGYRYGTLNFSGALSRQAPFTEADRDFIRLLGRWVAAAIERQQTDRQRDGLLQDLAAANQELNEFAYVVSHDLKAPLRAIGSLAGWIATDYADRLDDDGREQLGLLTSRVQRMHNLIEGILQYSRAGRVREDKADVDLEVLVRDVIDLLAPPPEIEVRIETPLPTVHGEPTRISQVFQNLLSNAIKYMDKPHGVVRLGCTAADGLWRFSVADNGPGIDAKYHTRIFQLFQTLAPRDDVEGTGVGLSLVKRIVEQHGGRVEVASDVGAGSTFTFTLPQT